MSSVHNSCIERTSSDHRLELLGPQFQNLRCILNWQNLVTDHQKELLKSVCNILTEAYNGLFGDSLGTL